MTLLKMYIKVKNTVSSFTYILNKGLILIYFLVLWEFWTQTV